MLKIVAALQCGLCILLGCVNVVHSISWCQCNPLMGTNCKDPFSSSGVTTCDGQQCIKSVGSSQSASAVIRLCSPFSIGPNECKSVSEGGVSVTQCTCSTNLCNSAYNSRSMSPALSLFISLLTVTIISIICRQ